MGIPLHPYPIFSWRVYFNCQNYPIWNPQGRFIFLHCTLYGMQYLIMAYYIPPPYNSNLVNEGFLYMAQHPTIPAIWLGDFNMILNPAADRLQLSQNAQLPNTTRFGRTLQNFR